MTVTTTQELELSVLKLDYILSFAWSKKRGVDKDFWFTPTGTCKVWIGALNTGLIGKVSTEVYDELIAQLKANKTEVFVWGSEYYTTTGKSNISRIFNMNSILYASGKEWEDRKYIEGWVVDNRSLTEV